MQNKTQQQQRRLFNVSGLGIIWLSMTAHKFIINFEQVMKSFLVWNIYFTFLYHWLTALFTRVLKSNFIEI